MKLINKRSFIPSNMDEFKEYVIKHGKAKTARHYNTTLAQIIGACKRNNIIVAPYKGITKKGDSASKIGIENALKGCNTIGEAARSLRLNRSVFLRLVEKYGMSHLVPKNKFSAWEEDRKKIRQNIELYKKEHHIRKKCLYKIADEHGLSVEQLKRVFKEDGIDVLRFGNNQSEAELEVCSFVSDIAECETLSGYRTSSGFELDIYIPDHNLAIEYCGLYWHSHERKPDKGYHYNKYKWCADNGIKLVTLFENEWHTKKNLVKSMLKNYLNMSTKIGARKTTFKVIDAADAKNFHEENHIHGYVRSSLNGGLFYNGELMLVVSLSRPRFNKKYEWEITRFSTKQGFNILGGLSKVLKNLEIKNIHTYADLRFGEGKCYEKVGFRRTKLTPPNYWYFQSGPVERLINRMSLQKKRLKVLFPEHYDDDLTEYMIAKRAGYNKIYDCGNMSYELV